MDTFIHQKAHEAVYPDVLWNMPLNKNGAGKLLIIGGNKFKFFAPALAQKTAEKIGIGHITIVMPDVVKKIIGKGQYTEYAPSNPSGSFSAKALDVFQSLSHWSDAVLLAGDAGHNSETSLLVEKFLKSYTGQLTITQDFLDMFVHNPEVALSRDNTLLVTSFSQLQKIVNNSDFNQPFTYAMPLKQCLRQLSELTKQYPAYIITYHQDHLIASLSGKVSTTKIKKDIWRIEQATKSAVMWLQQSETPFETITTSLLDSSVIKSVD